MKLLNIKNNKSEYYKISGFIFLYFFTWSASIGLLPVWLGETANLSSSIIGTIFAVNGVFSVIMKPIYGYILDKLGMRKNLLYFVVALSALMAPFFIYIYQPLLLSNLTVGITLGAIYFSMAWYAGVAACESFSDRYSRLNDMEFGQIRMWGSLGWAVACSFSGVLFNISPTYNFILGSISSLAMLLVLVSLNTETHTGNENKVLSKDKIVLADVYALFKNRKFWAFCLYVAGVVWMMFIAEQQFVRYFVTFFDDEKTGNIVFGYLGTVQSATEFVMYMFIPVIVNYIGAKRGLLIVGFAVSLRLILSGMCHSHLLISVLKPLYGVEICLLLVSVFKYISEHFDERVNATMYLLGYQAMLYVGSIAVSSPAGYLYDRIGFDNTYIIMGSIALIFSFISTFTLSKCKCKKEKIVLLTETNATS
ncbi:TPA: oligosaccharide MFS transporter [Vibrio parahaemolyticus]